MHIRNVLNTIREEFSDWLYEAHCSQEMSIAICWLFVLIAILMFVLILKGLACL